MTAELENQTNHEVDERDAYAFTPNVQAEDGIAYEKAQVRSGIKPISSIDVLDEPELTKFLTDLRSLSGAPEAEEIENIQSTHLVENAKSGKQQRRLSHREVFKAIYVQKQTDNISDAGKSLWDMLPGVRSIRQSLVERSKKSAMKNADSNFVHTELMLAKDWRQSEHDLPPVDVEQTKELRDKYYNFDTLYRQLILNLADYVGQLPASESHHHNWPGGLLKHSLEVAIVSLKYSKAWDLPPISLNDYEARRRPRWQYAAFVIGLLHDVGKAITDMVVVCEDAEGRSYRWNPMLTSLNQFCSEKKIVRYFVDMNDASKYMNSIGRFKRHEGMASALLENMLTPECRHFLTSSPDPGFGLYEQVTSILSGKKGDEYLMRSLEEGEKLSIHLSYKKIRSDFHLNNRNASVAELMMRELPYMTEHSNFMNNVFIVGGYVLLRYPEALNQLKQAVMNKSPETKSILNYKAMELGKQLSSSNFIRKVSNNNFIPRFAPTKAVTKKGKTTYEREQGFFSVVILEHYTQLFGQKDLPPSTTGVLSLSIEHSLEFIGDDGVIEHTHEAEKQEVIQSTVSSILDPNAKFKVVKQVKTTIDESDPDSFPGEKATELSDVEVTNGSQPSQPAVYAPQVVRESNQARQVADSDKKATQKPQEPVKAQNAGGTTTKASEARQQARKALQRQHAEKSPIVQTSAVDVFALDQPTEVVSSDKVYDAPESLLEGVDDSAAEVPNEENDKKGKGALSKLISKSGIVEVNDSSVSDSNKTVDSNVDTKNSTAAPPAYGDMPPAYGDDQVPLDAYQDMGSMDYPDDDSQYSGYYDHLNEQDSTATPAPVSPEQPEQDKKPDVDIVTELYGEWIQISDKNLELFKKGSIAAMLFKAPFFTDNSKRAGRDDWAVNGKHVEKRNARTVKLKKDFINSVLDYAGLGDLEKGNEQSAVANVPDTPVQQSVDAPASKDVSDQTSVSKSSDAQDKLEALRRRAKTKGQGIKTNSDTESSEPSLGDNPSDALAADKPEPVITEEVSITEEQLQDNGENEVLERLRNKVLGNPTLEGKFKSGRIPKVLFNSTVKSLDYSIEQLQELGLVTNSDVRNVFIDADMFSGAKQPKIKNLISPKNEKKVQSDAALTSADQLGDVESPTSAASEADKTVSKTQIIEPVSDTLQSDKIGTEELVETPQPLATKGVEELENSISTTDIQQESQQNLPVHQMNDVHETNPIDGLASSNESTVVHQRNEPQSDADSDQLLEEKVQQAMLRVLSKSKLQEQLPSNDQETETKVKIGLNIQVDVTQIPSMPTGHSPILMLLLHKIRKGEVYETVESKISRDNKVSILLSDFLNQCRVFFESKRNSMKVLNKVTDEELETIAVMVWLQFAGQENKVTVEITK